MSHRPYLLLLFLLVCLFAAVPVFAQESVHTVQPGENLFRISLIYGVDVPTLAQANGITNTWQIFAGQQLVIPTADEVIAAADAIPEEAAPEAEESADIEEEAAEVDAEANADPDVEARYYTVRAGQNLAQIARENGISAEQLARLNDISNPNLIYAGQRLLIEGTPTEEDIEAEAAAENLLINPNSLRHVVQSGENLASIGQRYGISWLAIAQANNIFDSDRIVAGEELIIPNVLAGVSGIVDVPAAPAPVHGVGREVIIDLSDSRAYAYENGVLVRNVIVSTGLPATPTVRGDFRIQRKYSAQTMTGPGYYLPDVPYVAYFYAGYALHGTYWHNNFGQPMSHGCVNLPTPEAGWFYNFVDIGTPIRVQA